MEKMYKFKESVPSEERSKVMEIIKYHNAGKVYESSLEAHPELRTYFEDAGELTEDVF